MPFSKNTDIIYADGPMLNPHQPPKPDIRAVWKETERVIDAFLSGGTGLVFSTLDLLNSRLDYDRNVMAWVMNDPDASKNGVYRKVDASGAGSWARMANLPFSFMIAFDIGAGTPSAIQATTSLPVSDSALVWMNIAETNAGTPVSVSFNGGPPLMIKTSSGNDVVAGGLMAGSIIVGIVFGATFRLLSDQASAAVIAAAEAAASASAGARTGAETARDIAQGFASDIVSQGNVPIFSSVVTAAAVEIPAGVSFIRLNGRSASGDGGGFAAQAVADADYLGVELCRNGSMSSDQYWDKGLNWSIAGGFASKTGTNNSTLSQGFTFQAGATYEITFTLSNYSGAGSFRAQLLGGTTVQSAARTANGTYTQRLVAAAGNNYFSITGIGAGGSIDDVSIRKVQSSGQIITSPAVNRRRWDNREDTITPAMFSDVSEMFEVTRAQLRVPAKSYEFGRSVVTKPNLVMRVEPGAVFRPTYLPTGLGRQAPLILLGSGADVNYFHLDLVAGINTIRTGLEIGDDSQLGMFKATSVNLNNNRTEPGNTDLFSGALLVRGKSVRVGIISLNRFDRGWTVINSKDVFIEKIQNIETVMGGFVSGTRDLHIHSAFTTGPIDPTEPNSFVGPRGIMTPGANSLVLCGAAGCSFSNWFSEDMLEHAIRVGYADPAFTTVPNQDITFNNVRSYRPYGCGFKSDDADHYNNKDIFINGLYTEDVGHGYWSLPDYSPGGGITNDENKVACALRNSQFVTLQGFMNRSKAFANSGQIGLWLERSSDIQVNGVDTERARADGVVVQSGGGNAIEKISIRGVASRLNGGAGVRLKPTSNSDVWRDVSATGINAQMNTGGGVVVDTRPDGTSPFAGDWRSKMQGDSFGNSGGNVILPAIITSSGAFKNQINTG